MCFIAPKIKEISLEMRVKHVADLKLRSASFIIIFMTMYWKTIFYILCWIFPDLHFFQPVSLPETVVDISCSIIGLCAIFDVIFPIFRLFYEFDESFKHFRIM